MTTKTHRLFIALLAAALPAALAPAQDGGVEAEEDSPTMKEPVKPGTTVTLLQAGEEPRRELRYTVEPGSVQRFLVTTRAAMEQSVLGIRTPQTLVPEARVTIEALTRQATKNGEYHLRLRSIDADVVRPQAGPAPSPQIVQQVTASLKGASADATVTNRGIVRSMRFGGPPANPSAMIIAGDPVEIFRQAIRDAMIALPEEPVGVGARWRIESVTQVADFTSSQRYECRVLRMDDETIELTVESSASAEDQPLEMPRTRQEMSLRKMESIGKGAETISLDRLLPVESSRQAKADMEITITGRGGTHSMLQNVESWVTIEPAPEPEDEDEEDESPVENGTD